ncbi:DUF72 domain-containing protein [Mucilaginibacter terrenus]|uniref:DUF72 domain-containing protein n=1 Tax=Mucilaginibacter terrenus TaxID=2482727 RepID=A0A3E2NVY3_9SPHI|nr:DUF72 domain-containing protein [Mucilaginibacter terrenus]RFZ85178.1 DUF72 domain-containing protein [Mucilaginibacter terrenus]
MEFGLVKDSLDEIDFTLPPDTELTNKTLQQKGGVEPLQIYVGASKWGEKSWKGIIYPSGVPDNQLIRPYSQNFNSVEFGGSFYKIYTAEEIGNWVKQVTDSPGFKFSPKFPQTITHIRRLKNAEEITAQFYQSLSGYGDHLGPLLLQLGDNFSPKNFPQLKAFLETLDPCVKVAVELRNKKWYSDTGAHTEVFNLFAELKMGTIISDTSGRRDCVHMDLTTTDAIVRFVGNNLDATDYKRMDDWVGRIGEWSAKGLKSLYFFMHQNNEKFVPEACIYFINKVNARLGTSVKAPQMIVG